ncbi:dsRBD fold-containing protein [Streptomyces gilvosporeus]|uniref:DUF1876 domain-containing protein n=1 Tax=Streptomyces gilvosporeus TaxID=553510 RepID=A0A1V0TKH9_9ACTN|nr:dsRBD fold-containing protein [Streptomyces gilvosporeus]ARF53370.1 hypothetical protein B1H19_03605 [Streptomyces gilvosporeus]
MARTGEWGVRLYLFEDNGASTARVVLDTGTNTLTGHGKAQYTSKDVDVPEIGDELAASRAMSDLATQLMRTACDDLEGVRASSPAARTPSTDPAD